MHHLFTEGYGIASDFLIRMINDFSVLIREKGIPAAESGRTLHALDQSGVININADHTDEFSLAVDRSDIGDHHRAEIFVVVGIHPDGLSPFLRDGIPADMGDIILVIGLHIRQLMPDETAFRIPVKPESARAGGDFRRHAIIEGHNPLRALRQN